VFTPTGRLLASWNGTGIPGGRVNPRGIAAAHGRVYVADGRRVVVFTPSGAYVSQWGSSGTGPGQFGDARRIARDARGNVYVFDASPARIEKFDSNGKFITQFGISNPNGKPSPSDVYGATGLAVSPSGFLYVAGFYSFRIQKFTLGGQLVAMYQCGTADTGGLTCRPNDIAFDPAGNTYVIDYNQRILKFSESGAAPVLGKAVDIGPVSGTVLVKKPGQPGFQRLSGAEQIPVGSTVDATNGRVRLTSATNVHGATQAADFYEGEFVVSQRRGQALTTLKLTGGDFRSCPRHATDLPPVARTARRHPRRHLWGSGHGSFTSSGNSASASVRGTIWLTEDDCEGTLIRVKRGTVTVRDLVRHKTIIVHAPHSYFAARA
jgi:hypothetical protein